MEMGMNHWEWEEMALKKTFPLNSTDNGWNPNAESNTNCWTSQIRFLKKMKI